MSYHAHKGFHPSKLAEQTTVSSGEVTFLKQYCTRETQRLLWTSRAFSQNRFFFYFGAALAWTTMASQIYWHKKTQLDKWKSTLYGASYGDTIDYKCEASFIFSLHFYSKERKQRFLFQSNKMVGDLGWTSSRLRTSWGYRRTADKSNRLF